MLGGLGVLQAQDKGNTEGNNIHLAENAVVPATFDPMPPPGCGLVTIFYEGGRALQCSATAFPIPTECDGLEVLIGGVPAPQLYTGSDGVRGQINVQGLGPGSTTVQIVDGEYTSNILNVNFSQFSPGIYKNLQNGLVAAIDVINGTLHSPGGGTPIVLQYNPTTDEVEGYASIYYNGGGTGDIAVEPGMPTPSEPLSLTRKPSVKINGFDLPEGDVTFAGLAPGFAGLYQSNIRLRKNWLQQNNIQDGPVEVQFGFEGEYSNAVTMLQWTDPGDGSTYIVGRLMDQQGDERVPVANKRVVIAPTDDLDQQLEAWTGTSGYFIATVPPSGKAEQKTFRVGIDGNGEFYHFVKDIPYETLVNQNNNFGTTTLIRTGGEDPWNPGKYTLPLLRKLTVGCRPGQNKRFLQYPVKIHLGEPPANGLSLIGNIDTAFNQPEGRKLIQLVDDSTLANVIFAYDQSRNEFSRIGPTCEVTDSGRISLKVTLFENPLLRSSAPVVALHEILHALALVGHINDGPAYLNQTTLKQVKDDFAANGVLRPFELGLAQRVAALEAGESWYNVREGDFQTEFRVSKEDLMQEAVQLNVAGVEE